MPHHHRFKGLVVPMGPGRRSSIHTFRLFSLLLLLIYGATSILRMTSPPPAYSILVAETSEVFDSLKTHILSKERPLEVQEEKKYFDTSISCSSIIDGLSEPRKGSNQEGFLCCDRSHYRTDVCYMRGDVRMDSQSSSIVLYGAGKSIEEEELIRPYTRKWEWPIMRTVDEIRLRPINSSDGAHVCDVRHDVPALVFSTGGYTGNVYHEFNDGLLPLYITGERFGGEVVVVVVEYHSWWMSKYQGIVKKLTKYDVIDFKRDQRVHCFSEMIIGLKIHGELTINPSLGRGKGIQDFQALLGEGLLGKRQTEEKQLVPNTHKRPTLVIFIRNKSRVLLNLRELAWACQRIGFEVRILNPKRNTQLADIYGILNAADVMLGVHGAAMTHFLFMRPASVFIQIVPLGLNWAADEYYGEPARKLGLEYMEYRISIEESSLSKEYGCNDLVLVDPNAVNSKGWSETKRIYLEKQNVRVDMRRFHRLLERAYSHVLQSQSRSTIHHT